MGVAQTALSETTAMILAGGLGTRLRSVVADVPKVLAPVRGRPFLAWLLDKLARAGLRHVVLCTGYRGEMVQQTFGACYQSVSIDYSQEPAPLGTGGALKQALPLARSQTILALNGDSFCDADLAAFQAWHTRHEFAGSLLLTEVADSSRYGRVQSTNDGRIRRFDEKGKDSGRGWINAGLYLLNRDLFDDHSAQTDTSNGVISLERDLLPRWIEASLGGCPSDGKFLDIGTPESFAATDQFFAPAA
ncbi:MAG: galactokinase [Planctomycetaceae bacterium]|nr:galactokinase [Planctomycetaceae bacterium]